MVSVNLPPPDEELAAHGRRLAELIRAEILASGPMPFARYMELCLYTPGLGYYSAGLRKFGHDGDFITAPELGPLFAGCIARAIAPVLRRLEQPSVLELGPGSGRLAVDLCRALRDLDALPHRYWLLERSADLRERQIERLEQELPELLPRMAWLDRPPTERWDGVLLGNEVVDALPAELFQIGPAGSLQQRLVRLADGGFEFIAEPMQQPLARALQERLDGLPRSLPVGWQGEWQPEMAGWLHSVGENLRDGLALFADYGEVRADLYHPLKADGSLRCFYRHRVHADPFWWPGLNDVSIAIDFSALAEAGRTLNWELVYYDHQSAFLRGAGIDQLVGNMDRLPERRRLALARELKSLMLPSEMGERFKLIGFSHGLDPDGLPAPFTAPGQMHRL
jgi:SAM-dependent MidA family methyltransferase